MKRQRGRNRGGGPQGGGKPQHNINRAFDSNGPENIKIRGHAQHVYEKYSALARDALSAGDRVLGENYMQHAEHYFRTLRAIQPNRPASDIAARDSFTSGIDIDFEDEALETAMEEADAQAAERVANGGAQPQPNTIGNGQAQGGQGQGGQGQGGQNNGAEGEGGEARARDDRFEGRRDRYDRDQNRSQGDRQDGEFRRDRQNNQNGDRQNGQNGERQNNQNGEFRQNRDQNQNRDRDQNRDRGEFRRDRDDRFRDRPERTDRGDRPERQERWASDRNAAEGAAPAVETVEPAGGGAMLRSRDGEESHAPAFLGAALPSPAAPASALQGGDEAGEVRRPRTRTRRPRREEGEAAAPSPETEEA